MKFIWRYLLLTAVLLFLYFQLNIWQNGWAGIILVLVYFFCLSDWWQEIFRRVFHTNRHSLMIRVFAWLAVFLLLSFGSSIFIVFYKLTTLTIWLTYLLAVLVSWVLAYFCRGRKLDNTEAVFKTDNFILFKTSWFLLFIYVVVWLAGFYFLWLSKSGSVLLSPWQTISQYYLPIFFVLTFLSGIALFVRYKIKFILLILVLQSLLLHLYLPLSHQNPWGGDVWRHLAMEERIVAEEQILPIISEQKLSYSQLWGVTVLFSRTLPADLISLNKWLLPVIWSLAMPFILFRLGWLLFNSRRKGLWLVWLSGLVFPFQALGALTLPVSLGYLTFFFVLMLWLQYLREELKWQKWLALSLAVLMFFGYSLHFILIWLVILFSYLFKFVKNKFIRLAVIFISVLIFPVLEVVNKISYWPGKIDWLHNLKQFIGQFTGWFYATLIRPHDILSGNLFFNHTPDYAFVASIFTDWRWYIIPLMLIFILCLKYSIWNFLFKEENLSWTVLTGLAFTIFGGYFIGWYVLAGDRLFIRRLDLVLVFLWLVFIVYVWQKLLSRWQADKLVIKLVVLLSLLVLSWFGAMTYVSGPDMRVVSEDEFEMAEHIWQSETAKPLPFPPLVGEGRVGFCVLVDTWVLLPLEALSKGEIIGGGFPIDYQFGQLERVALLEAYQQNPTEEIINQAKQITGAEHCWVVGEDSSTWLGVKGLKKE